MTSPIATSVQEARTRLPVDRDNSMLVTGSERIGLPGAGLPMGRVSMGPLDRCPGGFRIPCAACRPSAAKAARSGLVRVYRPYRMALLRVRCRHERSRGFSYQIPWPGDGTSSARLMA